MSTGGFVLRNLDLGSDAWFAGGVTDHRWTSDPAKAERFTSWGWAKRFAAHCLSDVPIIVEYILSDDRRGSMIMVERLPKDEAPA